MLLQLSNSFSPLPYRMKPAPPPRSSTNIGQHASHEHSLLRLAGHLPGSHPLSLYVIFAFLAVKFCPVSHPPRGQVEIHDGQPQTPFARVGLSENVRLRESGDRLSTGDGSWFFCMLSDHSFRPTPTKFFMPDIKKYEYRHITLRRFWTAIGRQLAGFRDNDTVDRIVALGQFALSAV